MKRIAVITLFAAACAHVPPSPAIAPTARLLSGGDLETTLPFPNGIASAPDGRVWIGSVTSGTIVEVPPDGPSRVLTRGDPDIQAGTALRFDAPRGLLWGVAPDLFGRPRRASIVFAVAVDGGNVVVKRRLPEDAFANDIALDGLGGVYVTDSLLPRVLHIDGGGAVSTFAADARFAVAPGQLGLAGIARLPDGALLVGHFTSGKLFRIRPEASGTPLVEELRLPRILSNPDGIVALSDRAVLLCEGDYAGSQGRLLRLELGGADGLDARVDVVRDGIESPVNLTRAGDAVLVTDARIRARMRGEMGPAPKSFPIVRVPLRAEDHAAPIDIHGFRHPEGTCEGTNGVIYVSNMGATLAPTAKDGDGSIDVLDASGFVARRNAFPGVRLDSPKGMAFAGDRLWVADIDRLVVIDPASGTVSSEIDLRPFKIGLANDIAKETEHSVIFSATDVGAIFRADDAGHVTRVQDGITGANGLIVEGDDALVVGLGPLAQPGDGHLFRVNLRTGALQQIGDVHGRLDGIDRLPTGQLLVSDWVSIEGPAVGRFISFDGSVSRTLPLVASPVHGPADFVVSRRSSIVVVPRTVDGIVTVTPATVQAAIHE